MIKIDLSKCIKCGFCIEECPSAVLMPGEDDTPTVRYPDFCIVCGHCAAICPAEAITVNGLSTDMFLPVEPKPSSDFIYNLLLSRRSTRVFADRPVTREMLNQLIECGTNAGTASNAQGEGFIIITDKQVLSELEKMVQTGFWNAGLKYMGNFLGKTMVKMAYGPESASQMGQYHSFYKKMRSGEIPATSIFRNAPALIITYGIKKNPLMMTNAALAMRNMEIMALPLGLGTCWIGFLVAVAQRDKTINRFLNLKADQAIGGAIIVGFPKNKYKKTIPRKERSVRWI